MAAEPRDKGPARLTTRDADFETAFAAFVEIKREAAEEVGDAVAEIIAQVRREGDAALFRLTTRSIWLNRLRKRWRQHTTKASSIAT